MRYINSRLTLTIDNDINIDILAFLYYTYSDTVIARRCTLAECCKE